MRPAFHVVAERLCLDFVNTEIVENGDRVDLLGGFADLTAWCAATQVMSASQAAALTARWGGAQGGQQAFERAVRFRTSLRAMVEWIAAGHRTAPSAALEAINDILRHRTGELKVVQTRQGYETRFTARMSEPGDLLVPIAESAADLLAAGDVALVKKCQNPQCILYFYDTTKSHTRRWCSMTACGNRAKVAAHYKRTKREARSSR